MGKTKKGLIMALLTLIYAAGGTALGFAALNIGWWAGACYFVISAIYAYALWRLTERRLLRCLPFMLWALAAILIVVYMLAAEGWDALGALGLMLAYVYTVVPGLAAVILTYVVLHFTRKRG